MTTDGQSNTTKKFCSWAHSRDDPACRPRGKQLRRQLKKSDAANCVIKQLQFKGDYQKFWLGKDLVGNNPPHLGRLLLFCSYLGCQTYRATPLPTHPSWRKGGPQAPALNSAGSREHASKPAACSDSRRSARSPSGTGSGRDQGGHIHGIRPSGEGKTRFGPRFPAARLREGASPTSNMTSSSVPALPLGAQRANQPAGGHSHPNMAKASLHWELANILPCSSAADIPCCGAKGAAFSDWRAVGYRYPRNAGSSHTRRWEPILCW